MYLPRFSTPWSSFSRLSLCWSACLVWVQSFKYSFWLWPQPQMEGYYYYIVLLPCLLRMTEECGESWETWAHIFWDLCFSYHSWRYKHWGKLKVHVRDTFLFSTTDFSLPSLYILGLSGMWGIQRCHIFRKLDMVGGSTKIAPPQPHLLRAPSIILSPSVWAGSSNCSDWAQHGRRGGISPL